MKQTRILLFFLAFNLVFLGTAQAQEQIQWMKFEEAIAANAKNPKMILVDVYTDWCSWCKKMDKNTYLNQAIIKQLNEDFYFIKLNAETKDSIFFDNKMFTYQAQYKVNELALALLNGQMSYPSTVFLDEKFALLTVVPGYLTPKDLSPILTYFGKNFHLKMKWEEFIKTNSEK